MRISHLFAVLLAVAGASAVTPASAATTLTKPNIIATPLAEPPGTGASTNQYRDHGWRGGDHRGYRGGYGYRGNRGWHGNRGWRRGYYRPHYYAYRPYRWRPRMVCRTSWRWGEPHRVCFRRW